MKFSPPVNHLWQLWKHQVLRFKSFSSAIFEFKCILTVFIVDEEVVEIVADEEKTWVAIKFKFGIETIAARIYKDIKELVRTYNIFYHHHHLFTITITSLPSPSSLYHHHHLFTITIISLPSPSSLYHHHHLFTITITSLPSPSSLYHHHSHHYHHHSHHCHFSFLL